MHLFLVGGDWESPVLIYVYWDGKYLRAYVPTKGNTYRTDEMVAFGSDNEDTRAKYFEKYSNEPVTVEEDEFYDELEINKDWCMEDFESRLEIV